MTEPDRPSRADRVRPWVALLLPALAWVVYEYGLGSSLRASCTAVGSWLAGISTWLMLSGLPCWAWAVRVSGAARVSSSAARRVVVRVFFMIKNGLGKWFFC